MEEKKILLLYTEKRACVSGSCYFLKSLVILCKNSHYFIVCKIADSYFVMQNAPNIGCYGDCLLLDNVSSCLIDVSFTFSVIN